MARIASCLREEFPLETYYGSTKEALAGPLGMLRMPNLMLRNPKVLGDLETLQRAEKFDFWQVHNVFPAISIAVYELAASLGVPVIQYLHNYRFGCVGATYFTGGERCKRCKPGAFMPGVLRRCWRGSLPSSIAMARALNRFWKSEMADNIQLFIAISDAQKRSHVSMGIPSERIEVVHHFLDAGPQDTPPPVPEGDALFIGRITEEKGVGFLVRAWAAARVGNRRLRIVGDGPALPAIKRLVSQLGAKNVVFEGFVPKEKHSRFWREAAFFVAPSIWEEPFGMVVLEAWQQARPVLATNLGSFPELVDHGVDGWLAEPQLEAFTGAIERAVADVGNLREMGEQGRRKLERDFNRTKWLQRMTELYAKVGV